MKRAVYGLLSLLLLTTGCEKYTEEIPYLSAFPTDDIYFPAEGAILSQSGVKIEVNTNLDFTDWDVTVDHDWCWVSKSKALGYFWIQAWSNDEPVEREATVAITSQKTPPVYIKVRIAASAVLGITPSNPQKVSARGGRVDVAVKSDASWTVRSDKAWAVVSTESGTGDGCVRISVSSNPNRDPAVANITFSSGGVYRTLVINQEGDPNGPYITISPGGTRKFPVSGGTVVVSVTSNVSWSVSSDKTWARVETTTGKGNGSTRIFVDANKNNENSMATISFQASTASRKLKIEREYTQPEKPVRYVRQGYNGSVVYSIDGKYIRQGYSGSVVYSIDGKYIRQGYAGSVVYSIDGKYIREGYYGNVAYSIDGKYIRQGYYGSVVYTLD